MGPTATPHARPEPQRPAPDAPRPTRAAPRPTAATPRETRTTSRPAAGGEHPDRPRGLARRAALLEATLSLLGEVGADAVTHRRVAEQAALPLASTTYWFASKEELLTEALRHAAQRDVARLHQAAAALGSGNQPLTPEAVVDVLLDRDGEGDPDADTDHDPGTNRGWLLATYTLMIEAARRPALQEVSAGWTNAYLETIGGLLARAGSRRPAADAQLLIAAVDGLQIDGLAGGGTDGLAEARPELRRLVRALVGSPR